MNAKPPALSPRHLRRTGVALSALLAAALLLAPTPVRAQSHEPNGFSLGLVLGDPTGLSLRAGMGVRSAIQLHIGFSPFPGDAFAVMVDWTYDVWNILPNRSVAGLLLYLGVGAKASYFTGGYFAYRDRGHRILPEDSRLGVGMRGVIGLRVPLHKVPIDLFVEVAPVGFMVVFPYGGLYYDPDLAIGARFRF